MPTYFTTNKLNTVSFHSHLEKSKTIPNNFNSWQFYILLQRKETTQYETKIELNKYKSKGSNLVPVLQELPPYGSRTLYNDIRLEPRVRHSPASLINSQNVYYNVFPQ